MEKDLKLIVMKGAKPLGEKVDSYLKKAFNTWTAPRKVDIIKKAVQ